MTKRGNYFLLKRNNVATGAMLSKGKTGFGTSRLNAGVVYDIVIEHRNDNVRSGNLNFTSYAIYNGIVRAVGRASRLDLVFFLNYRSELIVISGNLIIFLVMTGSGYLRLRNSNSAASYARAADRPTGFGTGRSLISILLIMMRNYGNLGLRYGYNTANSTLLSFCKTGFGTSGLYLWKYFLSMTKCFALSLSANGAGLRSRAVCIYPFVTKRFALGFTANGAGLRSRTVCIYPFVTERIDRYRGS